MKPVKATAAPADPNLIGWIFHCRLVTPLLFMSGLGAPGCLAGSGGKLSAILVTHLLAAAMVAPH